MAAPYKADRMALISSDDKALRACGRFRTSRSTPPVWAVSRRGGGVGGAFMNRTVGPKAAWEQSCCHGADAVRACAYSRSGLQGSRLMTLILPLGSRVITLTLSVCLSPSIPSCRSASRKSASEIMWCLRAL